MMELHGSKEHALKHIGRIGQNTGHAGTLRINSAQQLSPPSPAVTGNIIPIQRTRNSVGRDRRRERTTRTPKQCLLNGTQVYAMATA